MRLASSVRRVEATHPPAEAEREWDRFVSECPGGDLVQASCWGRFKRAVGQDARLVTLRDASGEVVGGAQIVLSRPAPGLAAGYVARGPVLRPGCAEAAGALVDAVLSAARSAGVRALIVQPPEGVPSVVAALDERDFGSGCPAVAPEATIRIDPRLPDGELLDGMSRMRRRNLRKPVPPGLSIGLAEDVEAFQRLHAATAERQGFRAFDPASLRAQWGALAPEGRCAIMMARQDGVPVAAAWFTRFAGTITYKMAGWDAALAERLGAGRHVNELLHWESFRWARESGAVRVDLGGLARGVAETVAAGRRPPPEVMRTPAHFKLGFGGEVVLLPVARWALTGRRIHAIGRRAAGRLLAGRRAERLMGRLRTG